MKLKDINKTVINPQKLSLLNDSAIDSENQRLTVVLDTIRYAFYYNEMEDLLSDYKELYSKIEGM